MRAVLTALPSAAALSAAAAVPADAHAQERAPVVFAHG